MLIQDRTDLEISAPFSDTDLCVKCGLCLPHCPTYTRTLDENESPRGRLALIQGWAAGELLASPKLLAHLDNCLMCRSCEAACPAKVPYGRLLDQFRASVVPPSRPLGMKLKSGFLRKVLEHPRLQRLAARSLRTWARRSGALKLVGLAELEAGLPEPAAPHPPWYGSHPASGSETARVGLFLGCTAELADSETVSAAIRLLNRLGVTVVVPESQGCCGALALHAGKREKAGSQMQDTLTAFGDRALDAILTIASGCGATIKEYGQGGEPKSAALAPNVADISQYLHRLDWPEQVLFRPLDETVWLHTPCSLKNVLRAEAHPVALLRRIPGLEVRELPATTNCCGGAGSYMLEHPQMAKRLRDDLIGPVLAGEPEMLVTSNVGCALHLRSGLRTSGRASIRVLHPVVLLEQQTANT